MNFLQELTESKLFANSKSSFSKYNARDILDLLFIYLITFQFLKYTNEKQLQKYLKDIGDLADCNRWKSSSNDFYILLYLIYGTESSKHIAMLNDSDESRIILSRISKNNFIDLRKFLRFTIGGLNDVVFERRFLLGMEKSLGIQNPHLKSMRRLVSDWNNQNESNKKLVSNQLYQLIQTKLKKSDLYNMVKSSMKVNKFKDDSIEPIDFNEYSIIEPKDNGLRIIKLLQKPNIF